VLLGEVPQHKISRDAINLLIGISQDYSRDLRMIVRNLRNRKTHKLQLLQYQAVDLARFSSSPSKLLTTMEVRILIS
jgi:hypothetical protein